ncbi:hypothetical protein Q5P01_024081 [Channa striata]|uniref:Uncharacterized protein n=1 Tax=Channa striata TaxID=64152 RepID=A0AA88J7B9_CHASR|nr:hypothetical protein Q5P01_024081 [Channa striata]
MDACSLIKCAGMMGNEYLAHTWRGVTHRGGDPSAAHCDPGDGPPKDQLVFSSRLSTRTAEKVRVWSELRLHGWIINRPFIKKSVRQTRKTTTRETLKNYNKVQSN